MMLTRSCCSRLLAFLPTSLCNVQIVATLYARYASSVVPPLLGLRLPPPPHLQLGSSIYNFDVRMKKNYRSALTDVSK